MNKDEVERGYNNRAAVPEHPQHFATYAAWSRDARAKYAPKANLRYGPNPRELLDLFLPAGTPGGTYLYIHGGYWRALSKEDYSFVAGPFFQAARNSAAAAATTRAVSTSKTRSESCSTNSTAPCRRAT